VTMLVSTLARSTLLESERQAKATRGKSSPQKLQCDFIVRLMEARSPSNALVQLQAQYHHCGAAASEKCLAAATFVR